MRPISHALLTLAAAGFVFVPACAPLPDAKPFAAATADLSNAVRSSGRAAADELRLMTNGEERAAELEKAWKARLAVMDAMVLYADALVDLVESSNQAGDAAAALADKVGNLATAAGIINPAAGASVKVSADVAKLVWTNIARAKGAASLKQSLAAAQPAIEVIADTIAQDNADLRKAVDAALSNQESQALPANSPLNEIVGLRENSARIKARIIQHATASGTPSLTGVQAELDAIDRLLASSQMEYDAYARTIESARARHALVRDLLATTDDAISRWGVAHRQLVNALEKGRSIDMSALADAVVDIRSIIKKARNQ